ncbi:hypothetical protein [Stieleria varia]|uniref:Uncharacterized protein n=1 Tax=Stieleria varia TaxID=2528005 RepID=A0A5C5ZX97_9BACT|nr:hypothetical protein [Stieleria varia]TWT91756.1 hypothetical protein Pla52n_65060 [Stieleria varia]
MIALLTNTDIVLFSPVRRRAKKLPWTGRYRPRSDSRYELQGEIARVLVQRELESKLIVALRKSKF